MLSKIRKWCHDLKIAYEVKGRLQVKNSKLLTILKDFENASLRINPLFHTP